MIVGLWGHGGIQVLLCNSMQPMPCYLTQVGSCWMTVSKYCDTQWIGLRENVQESPIFNGKIWPFIVDLPIKNGDFP